ncbi:hypothetical protein ZWY2020_045272 [Hordeum vulgare]|nr:hypothetical protein ZWY2020_045272 [Hordeum vulgare]
MDSLSDLAFAFARFVAREHRGFRFPRRTFGLAVARRWNFGRRYQRRLNRNGGLRHRGAPYRVPRRRYGPGGGLRRRHTHRHHFHHVHRRVVVEPREEAPVIPQEVVATPMVVAAVPEVAADVGIDEASASNITTQLPPPPPVYAPMEWMLAGPSAGWLVDDPDCSFTNEELAAPPPPPRMYSCPTYEYGSRLPSPTPSDEDTEHFNPPGYDALPDFSSPPAAVPLDTPKHRLVINLLPQVKTEEIEAAAPTVDIPMLPDLNHPTSGVEEKEHLEVVPPSELPTPSPEARVLLRCLATAMAARPTGARIGIWSSEALGLTGRVADLRLQEADLPSSFARGRSAAEEAGYGRRREAGPAALVFREKRGEIWNRIHPPLHDSF